MRFRSIQNEVPLDRLGVPPCGRAYFFLLRQEKVAKKKVTPGYAVGCADSPALLEVPGGCGTRPFGPQTVLADFPRPFSVARRSTWGPGKASRRNDSAREKEKTLFFGGRPQETVNNHLHRFGGDAFGVPLRGAEQRRFERKKGEDCLRAKPEFRSPRSNRVAQGTPEGGADPGVAFSLATFFWRSKRKYARAASAEPNRQTSPLSP
ncbi:MAG: hypothetical protein H6R15_2932 [Proteobacteria bacterium]|nr:hypothetical protein [Pseudomonadota bacterium]